MAEVPASAAAATASSHTPSQPQGASHDTASAAAAPEFGWRLHARFLNRCLNSLGSHVSHEVNRMTIVFFALSGLDMLPHSQPDQAAAGLTALDEHVDARRKQEIADWILNLQVGRSETHWLWQGSLDEADQSSVCLETSASTSPTISLDIVDLHILLTTLNLELFRCLSVRLLTYHLTHQQCLASRTPRRSCRAKRTMASAAFEAPPIWAHPTALRC